MTKLEQTIRQVSDLRDFYMKIKKAKEVVAPASTAKWLRDWLALADTAMKTAPPGPSAREILEEDRNRLERR